jgi:chromosome segregation ATPase
MTTPAPSHPDALRPLMAKDEVLAAITREIRAALAQGAEPNSARHKRLIALRATIEATFDECERWQRQVESALATANNACDTSLRAIKRAEQAETDLARVRTELACSKGAAAGLSEALERAESELATLRAEVQFLRDQQESNVICIENLRSELSRRKDWISPETYALAMKDAGVVDRVAKAIAADYKCCWEGAHESARNDWRETARVAIATLTTALAAPACSGVGGKDGGGT